MGARDSQTVGTLVSGNMFAGCDRRHTFSVTNFTEIAAHIAVQSLTVIKLLEGSAMLVRQFVHLTSEAIVVGVVLVLGLPFFLFLAMPFIGS